MPMRQNGGRNLRAAWLSRIRRDRGLNQRQLAERSGVKPQAISQFERGIATPTIDTFDQIMVALGAWYSDFLLAADDPVPPRRVVNRPFNTFESTIEAVIQEFAYPTRKPEQYPPRMRCWTCHGRPGECECYFMCPVCNLPVRHEHECSGKLHSVGRRVAK